MFADLVRLSALRGARNADEPAAARRDREI
jgi:hypothetical protein